jgi:hypothetical protein
MTTIIPPRRNEVISSKGEMTQRFAEYLESLARQVNSIGDESTDNEGMLSAVVNSIEKMIVAIANEATLNNMARLSDFEKRLSNLELNNVSNPLSINEENDNQLCIGQQQLSNLSKRIEALENDSR